MSKQLKVKDVPYMSVVDSDEKYYKKPGGSDGGDGMDSRIKKLENDMQTIKTDLAVMKSNYVTSADLHKEINSQTKWIITALFSALALGLAIAKFIF